MKLGEIKVEAIKLMFVNYAFDMGVDDLQRMVSDENYGSYIVNMNGSISRALDRIQNACVVPAKLHPVKSCELVKGNYYDRFNTTQIKDLYIIDGLIAEDGCGSYDSSAEYRLEGSNLVLKSGFDYTVLYYPVLKKIDDNVGDMDEIELPEHIARLIPLYIKGDLYQEEEPALAADARNTFEMSLDDLKKNTQGNQTRIKRIYGY